MNAKNKLNNNTNKTEQKMLGFKCQNLRLESGISADLCHTFYIYLFMYCAIQPLGCNK